MTAAATGLATLGVAALPLDGWAGDPAHAVAAGIGYVTLAATPLLAAGPLADLGYRREALASRVIGVAALACLAGTTVADRSGLLQRMGLTLGDLWLVTAAETSTTSQEWLRARIVNHIKALLQTEQGTLRDADGARITEALTRFQRTLLAGRLRGTNLVVTQLRCLWRSDIDQSTREFEG